MREKKIKVLITSLNAGGGHKAVADCISRSLKDRNELIIESYHSGQQFVDTWYSYFLKIPYLWFGIYKSAHYWLRLTERFLKITEMIGAEKAIENFNPDIILCTHPLQGLVFLEIRKRYHLDYKVVTVITDYGRQKAQMHLSKKADFYLAGDEDGVNEAGRYIDKNKVFIYGTKVAEYFSDFVKDKKTLKSIIEKDLEYTDLSNKGFDEKKKTLIFLGGSGWTKKSKGLIFKLASCNRYNILVSCGKDKNFYKELHKKKNIYPFGFLPQELLSQLEGNSDLAILSSLGRGTLHEILEINQYPLFIHKYIKGQESSNVKKIQEWKVGIYESDDEKMIERIKDYFEKPEEYNELILNAAKVRENERTQAKVNFKFIEQIRLNN